MIKKNIRNLHGIKLLFIFFALLIICTITSARIENPIENSDSTLNIQKTLQIRHIDPNTAAKVVKKIIKLGIFDISKETLIVPDPNSNTLTIQNENAKQTALITEIVKNIDFEVINEGFTGKRYIKLEKLVFDDIYKTIVPLFSNFGHASYNIRSHILEVTEIAENLDNFENLIIKLDTNGFYFTDSTPDTNIIETANPVEPNQDTSLSIPEETDTNSVEEIAAEVNEPMVAVQFSGFRIEQIVQRLEEWTGKKVTPSLPALIIRITIFSPEKMKRSKAIALLYQAITQQGFSVEETDDKIYIKPATSGSGQSDTVSTEEPLENIQDKNKVVQKVFALKNNQPSIMGQFILSYLSPSGYFIGNENKNTLFISDKVSNLIKIQQMIEKLDTESNSKGAIYPVNSVDPNK